jgi:dipeptidyl aminopeptidase/acylaminoacyl peptidase
MPETMWTPETMMRLRRVSQPRVSPDGRRVAFAVRETRMDADRSEYHTQIWTARARGGEEQQLTRGEASAHDPQWSPDGAQIAFRADRCGTVQVWRIPAGGGEAEPLTNAPTDVSSFQWSPDGARIAFTALDPPTPEEERAAREKDDARVVDAVIKRRRLFVIPVEPDAEGVRSVRQLTGGELCVGVSEHAGVYEWSPDGTCIAFTHTRTPKPDDWVTAGVSRVEVETGAVQRLVDTGAPTIEPRYSPDGRWVACKVYDLPAWEWDSKLHIVPAAGGVPRPLAPTRDRRPDLLGWMADGQKLLYAEACGTATRLYSLPLEGSPEDLGPADGVVSGAGLNATRTALAYVWEAPDRPPEAYASPVDALAPVQVSRAHGEGVAQVPGRVDAIRWLAADGLEIEGLLVTPADTRPGQRHPLLLSLHGGPAWVFQAAFLGSPSIYGPLAALAARGYAVLRPNVRGSTGYGKAFRHANYQDWGGLDLQDALAGVDCLIEKGVADRERLGVVGWSYGGFLAAAAVTQTRRFRAAVVGAGITNLISNAGTADIPSHIPRHFGAEPWQVAELLCARSPALHAAGVTTPTLILHGELDQRVPLGQGKELYTALTRNGCPAQMVVYPRTGHVPEEPKLLLDVMRRTLDWFDQYL